MKDIDIAYPLWHALDTQFIEALLPNASNVIRKQIPVWVNQINTAEFNNAHRILDFVCLVVLKKAKLVGLFGDETTYSMIRAALSKVAAYCFYMRMKRTAELETNYTYERKLDSFFFELLDTEDLSNANNYADWVSKLVQAKKGTVGGFLAILLENAGFMIQHVFNNDESTYLIIRENVIRIDAYSFVLRDMASKFPEWHGYHALDRIDWIFIDLLLQEEYGMDVLQFRTWMKEKITEMNKTMSLFTVFDFAHQVITNRTALVQLLNNERMVDDITTNLLQIRQFSQFFTMTRTSHLSSLYALGDEVNSRFFHVLFANFEHHQLQRSGGKDEIFEGWIKNLKEKMNVVTIHDFIEACVEKKQDMMENVFLGLEEMFVFLLSHLTSWEEYRLIIKETTSSVLRTRYGLDGGKKFDEVFFDLVIGFAPLTRENPLSYSTLALAKVWVKLLHEKLDVYSVVELIQAAVRKRNVFIEQIFNNVVLEDVSMEPCDNPAYDFFFQGLQYGDYSHLIEKFKTPMDEVWLLYGTHDALDETFFVMLLVNPDGSLLLDERIATHWVMCLREDFLITTVGDLIDEFGGTESTRNNLQLVFGGAEVANLIINRLRHAYYSECVRSIYLHRFHVRGDGYKVVCCGILTDIPFLMDYLEITNPTFLSELVRTSLDLGWKTNGQKLKKLYAKKGKKILLDCTIAHYIVFRSNTSDKMRATLKFLLNHGLIEPGKDAKGRTLLDMVELSKQIRYSGAEQRVVLGLNNIAPRLYDRLNVLECNEAARKKVLLLAGNWPLPKDVLLLVAEFSFYDNITKRLPSLQ